MGKPQSSTLLLDVSISLRSWLSSQPQGLPRQFSRLITKSSKPSKSHATEESLNGGRNSHNKEDTLRPFPLKYPLGVPLPPQEGENTGKDRRTLRQRREDFLNQEKHLQRRSELTKEFAKPYFRDWLQTRHHKGKTFLSNPRLFKADKALYFPNLFGRTLDKADPWQDTTPVLRGKVSVVSVFSTLWAEKQTATFVGSKQNPVLHELIENSGSIAQRVELNVEQNWLKAWLVRIFMGRLRRKYPREQHGKYFLVTKGFTRTLQEQIGMMNRMVGYVYLLDDACKIRWAGSSVALPDELTSLNNGLRKLINQKKSVTSSTAPSELTIERTGPSEQNKNKAAVSMV
ncbi:hypothetical protein VTO42DRAFT_1150 [Malbranchea cinnamomea]